MMLTWSMRACGAIQLATALAAALGHDVPFDGSDRIVLALLLFVLAQQVAE